MEKLRQVTVSGFRSLRRAELTFGDLTVFIGANGSGKSNVVALFNLLSCLAAGRVQDYLRRRGGCGSVLHYGPLRTRSLAVELVIADDSTRSTYAFTLVADAVGAVTFARERLELAGADDADLSQEFAAGGTEAHLLEAAAGKPGAMQRAASAMVERLHGLCVFHFHDTSRDAPIRASAPPSDRAELHAKGANLAQHLRMLQQRYPSHYERILAMVRLAVPYLHEFEWIADPSDPHRVQMHWRDRSKGYVFGPHQLADGSLRAIALVTALLQPEELMPWLIVLDEPELGLHPSTVGLVAGLMKAASAKRQVVAATQSPRILAECAPEDLVVVERVEDEEGRGESTFQRLSRQRLGDWLVDHDLGALYEMNVTGGAPQ